MSDLRKLIEKWRKNANELNSLGLESLQLIATAIGQCANELEAELDKPTAPSLFIINKEEESNE